MHLWIRLYLKWNGQLIGADPYGNQYYQEKKYSPKRRQRRFVLYKGTEEASKVPPLWHSWLHYTTNDVPNDNGPVLTSKTIHIPNLTGTPLAHNPKTSHVTSDGHLKKPDYTAWKPTH
ncbi:MAG: NADH-ubiquinone oxidoreductase subunit NDUFA12 family protein [Alphaproteobacteria bacterium]|nr:NADH-ubiquinone oxidoreductase subunit NDUFA12 family protein [Alphaproteobacteria bacterium]